MISPAERYYQSLAQYYKNLAAIKRCRAIVHVEGKTDRPFWEPVFRRYFPNDRFHFISYSKNYNGRESSGCTQCLKFRKYLNKRFFICIDSDYRRLMEEAEVDVEHYIFQTYTYSFENHLCFAAGLDEVCEKACHLKNDVFDFDAFLRKYSSVLYELFIWHIAIQNYEMEGFSKADFIQTIDSRNIPFDIENQGQGFFSILKGIVDERLEYVRREFPGIHIDREKAHFASLGVHEENVYLYIRGHNLYNLIVALCNQVCNRLLDNEKQRLGGDTEQIIALYDNKQNVRRALNKHLPEATYLEMQRLAQDMDTFSRM